MWHFFSSRQFKVGPPVWKMRMERQFSFTPPVRNTQRKKQTGWTEQRNWMKNSASLLDLRLSKPKNDHTWYFKILHIYEFMNKCHNTSNIRHFCKNELFHGHSACLLRCFSLERILLFQLASLVHNGVMWCHFYAGNKCWNQFWNFLK